MMTFIKNSAKLIVIRVYELGELSMSELANLLNRKEDTIKNQYVNQMCAEGILLRKHPDIINHPGQKHYAVKKDGDN